MAKKKQSENPVDVEYAALTDKTLGYKVTIKCKNQHQKDFLNTLKDDRYEICFGVGSAGSGKSYISLAYALSALKDPDNRYNKIIVIVPTVEAGSMNIGFLRGGIEEKTFGFKESDIFSMEKILTKSNNKNAKEIVNALTKEGKQPLNEKLRKSTKIICFYDEFFVFLQS